MVNHSVDELARQFKRHETAFEARIEPHPDHAPQFRLSFPDALAGLAVIDVSAGGVGLRCGVFLPKNLRLILHISDVTTVEGVASQILTVRAIVRRCTMLDHRPTYQIGLQFLDPTGADEQALLQAVENEKRRTAEASGDKKPVVAAAGGCHAS